MTLKIFLHKLTKAITRPDITLLRFMQKTWFMWPKSLFLRIMYWTVNGKWINLSHPRTFNEKLGWLKLHDHNPLYTTMADKFAVKEYVANIIGKEYVVPCLGIWNTFKEINFNSLPQQFVLKATHNSGGIYVCTSRDDFNISKARSIFQRAMNINWYNTLLEWVYRDIQPRIIADTFLNDHRLGELQDYKFWCFGGKPKVMYFTNKGHDIYENFYDMDFQPIDINHGFPRQTPEYEKPECFEQMKQLAAQLAGNIPFVRIDFFYVDGHIYFGEFTFYDWGGNRAFTSEETDLMLGTWIKLPIDA